MSSIGNMTGKKRGKKDFGLQDCVHEVTSQYYHKTWCIALLLGNPIQCSYRIKT